MIDYSRFISNKAASLKPSGIRRFFDIANETRDAISLGVGEPDFDTPWNARDAAIKSIQKGITQYTSNAGMLELRELISKYLFLVTGNNYSAKNEIIVTAGASEGIDLAMRAILNDGDEVLLPEPSYVSYEPCITLAGGKAVPIKTKEENKFKIKAKDIQSAISEKTKAIVLPYPNNPTGAIMEKADLEEILNVIIKNDILVISDEIYSELTYGEKHISISSFDNMRERCVVINGFSKCFAMTGWRLGYVAAPEELSRQMLKIHQYAVMCAPTASQYAALAALSDGFTDDFSTVGAMRDEYDMRRKFVVKRLNEMGLSCFEPHGAFYVFPSVKSTGMNGEDFSMALLQNQKVAVVPGSAFGKCGSDFIRISYAYSMKSLNEALDRIEKFLSSLK